MTTHIRIFRALFWKEFREALPVFSFSLAVALLLSFVLTQKGPDNPHLQEEFIRMVFVAVTVPFTFCLGFLFFLPLSSREPERDTLIGFRIKPIPPELLALFNWMSAFFMAVIALLTYAIGILLVTPYGFRDPIGQIGWMSSEFVWERVGTVMGYGIPLLLVFSFYFYLISSATANRLRSFALLLVLSTLVFVGLNYAGRSHAEIVQPTLSDRMDYFFSAAPAVFLSLTSLFLLFPCLFLIRARMTHKWSHWPMYATALVASAALFYGAMQFYASSRNVTQLAVAPAGNSNLIRSAVLRELGMTNSYRIQVTGNENQFPDLHIAQSLGMVTVPDPSQPLMLTISRLESKAEEYQVKKLFAQPLRDLFQADTLPNNTYDKYYVWSNLHGWETSLRTHQNGILIGQQFKYDLRAEYLKRHGGKIEDLRELTQMYINWAAEAGVDELTEEQIHEMKRKKFPDFFRFVEEYTGQEWKFGSTTFDESLVSYPLKTQFLGHYTLGDKPAFTPVRRIQVTYTTLKGRETRTIEAKQPGVFQPEDFEPLYENMPKATLTYASVTSKGDLQVLVSFEREGNSIRNPKYEIIPLGDPLRAEEITATYRNLSQLAAVGLYDKYADRYGLPSSPDHAEGNRFCQVDSSSGNFPLITAYDLSDPETLKITVGGGYRELFPRNPNDYWGFVNTCAIEGNRLYVHTQSQDHDFLTTLDISDPSVFKETGRMELTGDRKALGFGSPARLNKTLMAEDGKLFIREVDAVRIYSIAAPDSPLPIARILYPRRVNLIEKIAYADNEILLIHSDKKIHRFALGDTEAERWDGRTLTYLNELPAYRSLRKTLYGVEPMTTENAR